MANKITDLNLLVKFITWIYHGLICSSMANEVIDSNPLAKFLAWNRHNLFMADERNDWFNELRFFCFQIVRRLEAVTERKAKPRKVTLLSLYSSYRSSDQRWLKNYSTMHGNAFRWHLRRLGNSRGERYPNFGFDLCYIRHSHAALTHFRLLWSNIPGRDIRPSFIHYRSSTSRRWCARQIFGRRENNLSKLIEFR